MILTITTRFANSLRFRFGEWLLGGAMFSWGWMLLRESRLFDLPTMVGFASMMPQITLGTILLALAGLRVAVLMINGAWKQNPHARLCLAIMCGLAWLFITGAVWRSGIGTPGMMMYPLFALGELYVVSRAAGETVDAYMGPAGGKC